MFNSKDDTLYELHTFSDSANEAYGCVVYLYKISNVVLSTSFVYGKNTVVLGNQQAWDIARKELTATIISVEMMKSDGDALQIHFSDFILLDKIRNFEIEI